jgi:hypothetical protein
VIFRADYMGQQCPSRIGPSRLRVTRRSAKACTRVCIHATGVAGGFDLAAYQVAAARGRLRKAGLAPTCAEIAIEALAERYRTTAYQAVYRPADDLAAGLSVVQWPVTDRTPHGHRTNGSSFAWAIDGKWTDEHEDPLDVDAARASLRHAVEHAIEQGAPITEITAHANHANKRFDPGPLVWLEVVRPVADELGLLIRPEWTTRGKHPWIAEWESAA